MLVPEFDPAIDLGGPISFRATALPNGMADILGHVLGLDEPPPPELLAGFSLHGLLDSPSRARLLAINGDLDPYVPVEDTTVFANAWLVKDAGHCVVERLAEVIPAALGWLRGEPAPESLRPLLADISGR